MLPCLRGASDIVKSILQKTHHIPRRFIILGCLALLVLAAGTLMASRRSTPTGPLTVGIWYWHVPFLIGADEEKQLHEMGISQIFIRAGSIQAGEDAKLRLVRPQQWESHPAGFETHLVFEFAPSVVHRIGELDMNRLADDFAKIVHQEIDRATKAGLKVAGIQTDLDSPTSKLPRYTEFLQRLSPQVHERGVKLSITALTTWLNSRGVGDLFHSVDFAVPQFYEGRTPKTLAEVQTISDFDTMRSGLRSADRIGTPFYVGLPAYGHALVYDEQGKLSGAFHELSAGDLARHPAFRLARSFPADNDGKPATPSTYCGEDVFDFEAIENAPEGRGKGYHVVWYLPSFNIVSRGMEAVKKSGGGNCRGVLLYRYPEPEETSTLPLASLRAGLKAEHAQPHLKVKVKSSRRPWELIETGATADRPPVEVFLRVTNEGSASAFVGKNTVQLALQFDRPGVQDVSVMDFDAGVSTMLHYDQPPGSPGGMQASLRRANVLTFTAPAIRAGQTLKLGPILIPADGATKMRGTWSVNGVGGFETIRGEIPETILGAKDGDR
jgi:hypothetical protein